MPALGAAAVDLVAQFALGIEFVDPEHRDLRVFRMPGRFRRVRRHRPEALAVMDKIRDRQVLAAHAHDVVVEPSLVDPPPFVVAHRLDVDAAHLDPDLRTHATNFEHALLPYMLRTEWGSRCTPAILFMDLQSIPEAGG